MLQDYLESLRAWCVIKIQLWNKKPNIILRQGDVWWCSVGINLGEETFGKGAQFTRPVLVFKKLTGNSFLGLPVTSQSKEGSWYVPFTIPDQSRWIMLNQARIFDKTRLTKKLGTITNVDFQEIKRKFHERYCP
jgi:mRNA interferase MazF